MSAAIRHNIVQKIHRASKVGHDGRVSALCFMSPRAINLRKASWTLRNEAVTCAGCLAIIAAAEGEARKG
jgi:hypothetical protein